MFRYSPVRSRSTNVRRFDSCRGRIAAPTLLAAVLVLSGCKSSGTTSDDPTANGGISPTTGSKNSPAPGVGSAGAATGLDTSATKTIGGKGASGNEAAHAGDSAASGAGGAANAGAGSTPATTARIKLTANRTMTCEAPGSAVSTQRIEAECAFGAATGNCKGTPGGQQGTQLEQADTTVGFIESGDCLSYAGVVMDGMKVMKIHYAKGVDGGKIEVRLDGITGQLIGMWTPLSTGAWEIWSDATLDLSDAEGTHSLYLVATESTVGIINLDWLELTAGGAAASPVFHLNQVGFDTLGPKHAVIEGPANLTRFRVVEDDGSVVWCGDLVAQSFGSWGSNNIFYSVDFSELTRAGSYRIQVGSAASSKFEISDDRLFSKTFSSVLGYFKSARADDADVWAADASVPFNGSDTRADVRGGWYDASGDISKYLSHLSYANYLNPQQIPLVAWALAWVYDQGGTALTAQGDASKVQAEALWGADYLLRVLDPAGFFYITVFDQWSGDLAQRQICAFEGEGGAATDDWQSSLREGGGMSIAALARVAKWKADGASTSADYLLGAEKAFAHLQTNGKQYADDGKENVIDDYTGLLAACELYATTQNGAYLDAARARASSLVNRLGTEGYFIADGASRPFWHASDAGLPAVALIRYLQIETDDTRKITVRSALRRHLDYQLRVTRAVANPYGYARQHTSASTVGFFIPHENESGYWWQGENARLSSLAAAALLGAEVVRASGADYLELIRFAGYQLDWVLGANPYDVCFLQGSGTQNPPEYCGFKPQSGTLVGGIANGITGQFADGSGIQWLGAGEQGCGNDWRWVEQWLPHAAWYMVAITALAQE